MNLIVLGSFIFSLTTASFVNPAREDFLTQWNNYYEAKLFSEMQENLKQEPSILEWEGNCEQETSEESREQVLDDEGGGVRVVAQDQPVVPSSDPSVHVETNVEPVVAEVETVAESQVEQNTLGAPSVPYYSVNGVVMDLGLQEYLYSQLCVKGIEWFMPYAMLLAYQESNFNIYAENKNGLDKGLFQYRITYWGSGDIFNPYTQIDIFTTQMANRANIGCTVSDMISRHNMSDYGPYNQDYVNHVMSWQGTLIRIN